MHCEDARAALLDRLDHAAAGPVDDAELETHLDGCEECRSLRDDLLGMQSQARVWHELSPPAWNADPAPWQAAAGRVPWPTGRGAVVQRWFPVTASTAALLLALGLYLQDRTPAPAAPDTRVPADALITGDATAAQLLAASRRERQEEMEALTALLKAEMDRRSLETEQSLKYIISHQIQSQRQLDAMRSRLEQVGSSNPPEQL